MTVAHAGLTQVFVLCVLAGAAARAKELRPLGPPCARGSSRVLGPCRQRHRVEVRGSTTASMSRTSASAAQTIRVAPFVANTPTTSDPSMNATAAAAPKSRPTPAATNRALSVVADARMSSAPLTTNSAFVQPFASMPSKTSPETSPSKNSVEKSLPAVSRPTPPNATSSTPMIQTGTGPSFAVEGWDGIRASDTYPQSEPRSWDLRPDGRVGRCPHGLGIDRRLRCPHDERARARAGIPTPVLLIRFLLLVLTVVAVAVVAVVADVWWLGLIAIVVLIALTIASVLLALHYMGAPDWLGPREQAKLEDERLVEAETGLPTRRRWNMRQASAYAREVAQGGLVAVPGGWRGPDGAHRVLLVTTGAISSEQLRAALPG